jgi:hypothetical protein
MTEVELIERINKKRGELENLKAQKAEGTAISTVEKEIEDLTISLSTIDHSRGRKAFLDECAG